MGAVLKTYEYVRKSSPADSRKILIMYGDIIIIGVDLEGLIQSSLNSEISVTILGVDPGKFLIEESLSRFGVMFTKDPYDLRDAIFIEKPNLNALEYIRRDRFVWGGVMIIDERILAKFFFNGGDIGRDFLQKSFNIIKPRMSIYSRLKSWVDIGSRKTIRKLRIEGYKLLSNTG